MVKEEVKTEYICEYCNKPYITKEKAEACEKEHETGKLKKMYVYGSYNVSEYMSEYELNKDDAIAVQYTLNEVELLVLFKDGVEPKIVGACGKYLDDNKLYEVDDNEN